MAQTTFTTATTTTWNCPSGVYAARVKCWGAGGNGGDGGGTPSGGNTMHGGGGGAYSESLVAVIPGSTYDLVIPAGGSGTDCSFKLSGTTLVLAKSGSTGTTGTPGAGGLASGGTGDTKYSGGDAGTRGAGAGSTGGGSSAGTGSNGNVGSTNSGDNGGAGGAAVTNGGAGGAGGNNNGAGTAGSAPGGAGGGGEDSGGAGARGQIYIEYTTGFSNALIDDIAFLNRDLTSTEVLTLYTSGGSFLSYSSALSAETLITSPSIGNGNGMAYYNNYIYLATNTNIDRYGPLNGTPAYTSNVWTGATLGTQTALTNTTYGFQSSYAFPNHPMVVHGDGAMYVCDYINGQGKIHRVKTTKTTFEGDTNNSSLYGALTLPFGFLPTDIQSYGIDLVILAVQTTDTTVNQGRSAMFFWDGSAVNFYKGPLYLPDALATALEVSNGQLYVWTGNAQGGVRLSKYIGGDSIQEVFFHEEGTPPPPGATSVYGSRLYWGNHITYPSDILGLFAYGSKTERLPAGLHCVAKATNSSTTSPAITAILPAQQSSGSRNKLIVAYRADGEYGISKYSTTGTYSAVWRSLLENTGGKFKIRDIRIPLGTAVATGMSIVPKILMDNGSTTVTLPTISETLYSGAKKIVYHGLELNECVGQDNFLLELTWGGTVALPVTTPILITYETYDDENISS